MGEQTGDTPPGRGGDAAPAAAGGSRGSGWAESLRERVARVAGGDRSGPVALAVAAVVVGAGLRLYRLGSESVWLDEAFTWCFVTNKYTMPELLFVLPWDDVHPPLYYLLVGAWVEIAGAAEWALRFPSVWFGVAGIGLLYLVAAKLYDRWTGAIAAALSSVSTFHLYFAQEARMYTLLGALTLASFYWFVDIAGEGDYGRWTVAGYVVASVLLLYTHVYGVFVILAQNLYLFGRFALGRRAATGVASPAVSLRGWLGVDALLGVLSLPWLAVLGTRMTTISSGGCTSITWIRDPGLDTVVATVYRYFFHCGVSGFGGVQAGGEGIPGLVFPAVTAIAVGLAAGGIVLDRSNGWLETLAGKDGLVLLWLLTPLVVPYVLSHAVTPIFVTRYTISASLALFVLVARGVRALRPSAPTAVRVALVVVLVASMAAPLPMYYGDDQKRPWDDAVESIEGMADAESLVLVSDAHFLRPYQYYAQRDPGTVAGIDHDIDRGEFRRTVEGHDSLYLVVVGGERTILIEHLRALDFVLIEARTEHGLQIHHAIRAERSS